MRDLYIYEAQPPAPAPPSWPDAHWPTPGQPVSNLPPRNPLFRGREELLTRLREHLSASAAIAAVVQPQAIHGLGGVGKTQVALEYAHRNIDEFDLIWWIRAEEPLAIPDQLASLGRRL
jgi:hypothetical protein